jgi:hypothetical protein
MLTALSLIGSAQEQSFERNRIRRGALLAQASVNFAAQMNEWMYGFLFNQYSRMRECPSFPDGCHG